VLLGLALVALVVYFVMRARRSPLDAWRAKASDAVAAGSTLFQGLGGDLATASAQGPPLHGFPERSQQIDVLAGQLAELAAGQGDPAAAAPLSGLRDEVDELRAAVRALETPQAAPQEAVQHATQRLGLFETALQRFDQSLKPSTPNAGGGTT
jgi:hypothetical protein